MKKKEVEKDLKEVFSGDFSRLLEKFLNKVSQGVLKEVFQSLLEKFSRLLAEVLKKSCGHIEEA